MSGLIRTVLSLSLSGSLLILLLLLLRPLVGERLSRRWRYYIWLLVIARLLLPLPSPVPLTGTPPAPPPAVSPLPTAPAPAPEAGGTAVEPAADAGAPGTAADGAALLRRIGQSAGWLYLLPALLLLLRRVTEYRRFVRLLRAEGRAVDDPVLLDRLSRLREDAGIRQPVALWESAAVSTPLLLGVRRPCIVLADLTLSEEEFRCTVCHELVHCRRRDVIIKWLCQLTLCVHWLNPLVRRMVREVDRACELSCDEAVTASLSAEERRVYGDTLLRAAGRGVSASLPLSESGKLLKERLYALMNDQKTVRMSGAMSLLLSLVLTAGAVTAGPRLYRAPAGAGAGLSDPRNAAASLPIGSVPAGIKGDADAAFRYTQEVYSCPPYFFELCWNVNERVGDYYPSRTVPLSAGTELPLYYDEVCGGVLEDPETVSALTALLRRLSEEAENTAYPLRRALLVSVRYVGSADTYADMAEQAYQAGEVGAFSAAFGLLGEEAQRAPLNRCYADGSAAFFAAALSRLPHDSPLVGEFAQRSYDDGRIAFFSVLSNGYMDPAAIETYLDRAEWDGRSDFRSVLCKASGRDEELEAMEAERDRQLEAEYRAHGITVEGKNYYYQGQLVRTFLDMRSDSSFCRLDRNPQGTVDIKVLRGESGQIQSVGYLTAEETAELFGEEELAVIPIALPAVRGGETVFLGEYALREESHIRYDVLAETGNALQVGFVRPGDTDLRTVYCSITNRRQQGESLRCTGDIPVGPSVPPGTCRLFLRAPDGALGNVQGSVSIAP